MQELKEFKACIDCKHFRGNREGMRECHQPLASLGLSLVTGRPQWQNAGAMRGRGNRLCGPEGKLWAPHPTPLRDKAQAMRLALGWYAGLLAMGATAPFRAVGARVAAYRAALATIRDNTGEAETPQAKDGQPIEPLPEPDKPKEEPKPGDLPQTDGRALAIVPQAANAANGGTGAGRMAAAVAVILAGYVLAGMMGERPQARATEPACAAPAFGEQARRRKATCCYRWHDGTTRCFDCSDTA